MPLVTATSIGDCATVSWTAPSYLPPIGFQYAIGALGFLTTMPANDSQTSTSICGLTLGKTYS